MDLEEGQIKKSQLQNQANQAGALTLVTNALINQFIAIAVAEKISSLETERFFAERAKQADMEEFRAILFRPGGEPPRTGDELG